DTVLPPMGDITMSYHALRIPFGDPGGMRELLRTHRQLLVDATFGKGRLIAVLLLWTAIGPIPFAPVAKSHCALLFRESGSGGLALLGCLFGYETSGRRINSVSFDDRAHEFLQPVPGLARSDKAEPPGAFHDLRRVDGDDGVALRRLHHDIVTELRVRNPHGGDSSTFVVGDECFHRTSSVTDRSPT